MIYAGFRASPRTSRTVMAVPHGRPRSKWWWSAGWVEGTSTVSVPPVIQMHVLALGRRTLELEQAMDGPRHRTTPQLRACRTTIWVDIATEAERREEANCFKGLLRSQLPSESQSDGPRSVPVARWVSASWKRVAVAVTDAVVGPWMNCAWVAILLPVRPTGLGLALGRASWSKTELGHHTRGEDVLRRS